MARLCVYSDKIGCRKCGWVGAVRECEEKPEEEKKDDPMIFLCPRCGIRLAIHGLLEFKTIDENAVSDIEPLKI